jgi:hypothetical protein
VIQRISFPELHAVLILNAPVMMFMLKERSFAVRSPGGRKSRGEVLVLVCRKKV